MPEQPVCTCIKTPVPGTTLVVVKVFDPYCQIAAHKARASTDLEPTYG